MISRPTIYNLKPLQVGIRKKMIVALARKLLVALWKFVTHGEVPEGVILNPAT